MVILKVYYITKVNIQRDFYFLMKNDFDFDHSRGVLNYLSSNNTLYTQDYWLFHKVPLILDSRR